MAKPKCYIEPYTFPGVNKVQPLQPGEEAFTLDGSGELHLFDSVAQEHTEMAGTEIDFYALDVEKSTRDPLYDEPVTRVWRGPFRMKAWVAWAESIPVVGESGFRFNFLSSCWIPRSSLEEKRAPAPFEGDVIRFWPSPFFDKLAVARRYATSKDGYFFDITNSDDDGHVFDQAEFVGFKCDLKRRSEFGAERRILPP
jgi:hypothetical protein